ncbi:hypothetical protein NDN08_006686 [Rhodosorus marinus]|uniref:Uncharacterized protein n=1 Tax=Rhodosorus marinus TaxID=101924 RepID=A0AAV8UI97_9RHOD|nr:hypothetical protein NDN08_006686 [Rhodosorus marinus]
MRTCSRVLSQILQDPVARGDAENSSYKQNECAFAKLSADKRSIMLRYTRKARVSAPLVRSYRRNSEHSMSQMLLVPRAASTEQHTFQDRNRPSQRSPPRGFSGSADGNHWCDCDSSRRGHWIGLKGMKNMREDKDNETFLYPEEELSSKSFTIE